MYQSIYIEPLKTLKSAERLMLKAMSTSLGNPMQFVYMHI